jgi:hypothetical protein
MMLPPLCLILKFKGLYSIGTKLQYYICHRVLVGLANLSAYTTNYLD